MKALQIIGLVIVGILLIQNSLRALAIGLALARGEVSNPTYVVGVLLSVLLFELLLIGGFSKLLRRVRAP
jgi:hypothetical protein